MTEPGYLSARELAALGLRSVGRDVSISRDARIYGAAAVSIGDHVRIDDFTVITAREEVRIGSNVHIAQFCGLYGGAGIELGDFSGVSTRGTVLSQSDDFSGAALTGPTVPAHLRNVQTARVRIGRHVVVGSGAIVLPGVTIGDGSAVGALSLVTGDVEAWTIVGGVPARKLKARRHDLTDLEREYHEIRQ
jgi:acetyltransferase-like isoleucine patch superfamily enzyme